MHPEKDVEDERQRRRSEPELTTPRTRGRWKPLGPRNCRDGGCGARVVFAYYFRARLTADTTARSEAVVMDVAMPAPHTVTAVPSGPVTDAST